MKRYDPQIAIYDSSYNGDFYRADEVDAEIEKLDSALYSMQDKVKVQKAEIEALKRALKESCDEERARCRAEGGYPCELQEEIERLHKFGQHCGCVSSEDGESIVESCMFHAKQREEIEALKKENNQLRHANELLEKSRKHYLTFMQDT